MRIEAAAEQFLRHLVVERGCSSLTAVAYGSDMRKLVEYLEQAGIEADVEGLTPIVLRRFVSFLAGTGYNPATIARRLYAASSMFKYLISYGHADSNPCASVVAPKRQRRMPAGVECRRGTTGERCPACQHIQAYYEPWAENY